MIIPGLVVVAIVAIAETGTVAEPIGVVRTVAAAVVMT